MPDIQTFSKLGPMEQDWPFKSFFELTDWVDIVLIDTANMPVMLKAAKDYGMQRNCVNR